MFPYHSLGSKTTYTSVSSAVSEHHRLSYTVAPCDFYLTDEMPLLIACGKVTFASLEKSDPELTLEFFRGLSTRKACGIIVS